MLNAEALTAQAFKPFGDVIETAGEAIAINAGTCHKFNDLARIDATQEQGRPCISIYQAQANPLPHKITVMERHPLSSQAFFPLNGQRFLIVVAAAGEPPVAESLHAYVSNGRQGINYARGVWHHPLIALDQASEFIVIERFGAGENCDELDFSGYNITVDVG